MRVKTTEPLFYSRAEFIFGEIGTAAGTVSSKMTRVVRIHELGGPEVLRFEDVDFPLPGPREVRIKVKALGINRAEVMVRTGQYRERPELPIGLGYEAAGLIDAIGADVTEFSIGDAVSAIPPLSMIRWPAYGELATFPVDVVVKHPSFLTWKEAAAVWMQYVTAYGGLIDIAKIQENDFVVITAASSSVGFAAIQVCNMVGATSIAATRTHHKKQALLDAGATHVIVTNDEDLETRLKEITGGAGARIVFDPVGGPAFKPLTAAMSEHGILIQYGALSDHPTPFPLSNVLGKHLTLRGYRYHEIVADPQRLESAKEFILGGLSSGALKPVIARTFSFDEIAEAHRYLESNEQIGKVVVTLD